MTTPPNYRRVECCGNCKHGEYFYEHLLDCDMVDPGMDAIVKNDHICDDYKTEDGE